MLAVSPSLTHPLRCRPTSRRSAVTARAGPADTILQRALREPVAFAGGLFAGLFALDVTKEPLKAWLQRTAEKAGPVAPDGGAEAKADKQ
jgi:hypothetical protein